MQLLPVPLLLLLLLLLLQLFVAGTLLHPAARLLLSAVHPSPSFWIAAPMPAATASAARPLLLLQC